MKRTITAATAALLVIGLSGVAAQAKEGSEKMTPEERFNKLDTNHDGVLSVEEYTTGKRNTAKAEARFHRLDKDKNGTLSLQEFEHPKTAKSKKKQ